MTRGRLVTGLVCVFLVLVVMGSPPPPPVRQPLKISGLETGDIILVGTDRVFWAVMASTWSTPKHRFGHAGIVIIGRDHQPYVVHAGGSPTNGDAPVRSEPLNSFLYPIDRAGIYRLKASIAERQAVAAAAEHFIKEGAVFDRDFTLNDRHRLYCTALVWRAVLEGAHEDIIPVKRNYGGKMIVTLADIERSRELREITYVVRP